MTVDIFNLTDTWNDSGTTFTAIKMNVTDTASASGSLLMDLQVGGVRQFQVAKDGTTRIKGRLDCWDGDLLFYRGGTSLSARLGNTVSSFAVALALSSSGNASSPDLFLSRDAANTLAQRNDTNAQTFRLYETYSGSGANYSRFSLTQSGSDFRLVTEAGGTGTRRNIVLDGANRAAKINDPSGGSTIDAEARTAINAIIDALESHGIAASA